MGLLLLPRRIAFLPTGRALIGLVLTAEAVGVARRRRLIAGGRLGRALTRRLAEGVPACAAAEGVPKPLNPSCEG